MSAHAVNEGNTLLFNTTEFISELLFKYRKEPKKEQYNSCVNSILQMTA